MKVLPAGPTSLRWLEHYADWKLAPDAKGLVAVDRHGRIRGVVAYECFTPTACRVHVAAVPIVARSLVPACFVFPFETLGLETLRGTISESNTRGLRFARACGFRETSRASGFVTHELRRDECRWLTHSARKAG